MPKHPHFMGNTLIMSIIPAACLSFLTLGTISVYGNPGDLTATIFALGTIFVLALVMVFFCAKKNKVRVEINKEW